MKTPHMLLLSTDFQSVCKDSTVYLDTNIFIYARENGELLELIAKLTAIYNVAFVTLSSVEYEFTRGSQTVAEIKEKKEFVRGLVSRVMPVGPLIEHDNNDGFSVAMSLCVGKKDSQYTDYLIAAAMHKHMSGMEKQYVLTADVPAFPTDIFTIHGVISIELQKNKLVHMNLVALDKVKYGRIIKAINSK